MSKRPMFTVTPTRPKDKVNAKQLQTMLNTDKNKEAFLKLVDTNIKDFLYYGIQKRNCNERRD